HPGTPTLRSKAWNRGSDLSGANLHSTYMIASPGLRSLTALSNDRIALSLSPTPRKAKTPHQGLKSPFPLRILSLNITLASARLPTTHNAWFSAFGKQVVK